MTLTVRDDAGNLGTTLSDKEVLVSLSSNLRKNIEVFTTYIKDSPLDIHVYRGLRVQCFHSTESFKLHADL